MIWLDFGWISVGFGLAWAGIRLDFGLIIVLIVLRALQEVQGGPREVLATS